MMLNNWLARLRFAAALLCLVPACGAGTGGAAPVSADDASRRIDELVLAECRRSNIPVSGICSDAMFVRRVFLDTTGALPTAAEARQFLLNRRPGKRAELIDDLLRREEFADYCAMKWSDMLRVKAEFPINLWPNAAQAYHRWIRTSILENKPYDRFVREMLTASGSNFRSGPVNFYRAMQNREPRGMAQAVALTFMGERAERWPAGRLEGMSLFFSRLGCKTTGEWKEEILFFDIASWSNAPLRALYPDGTFANLTSERDPREVFADWLIQPANPWFVRNISNRVWSWLLGRGVIDPVDDIHPGNPPVNPELLAFLEQEFIGSGCDLKHLYRVILNSQTYQRAPSGAADAAGAERHFACSSLRRLDAEVLIDALNQVTGSRERYSSAIPEPFTFIPEEHRAVALPDGSISSPFLELFGRSSRDTGLESERNNSITAAQRLHLLNSSHIQRKIEQSPVVQSFARRNANPNQALNALYLTVLSRFPTTNEVQVVQEYLTGAPNRREGAIDVTWSLINSAEFLYRH